MKATFNLPDELYREVKARSALEGRPVREVVIALFQQWLSGGGARRKRESDWQGFEPPLRQLVPEGVKDHSMAAIRESISGKFDETV